jgi:8-oxo-dGTP pyrophosphatase MutT (NUDIX family)
MPSRATSKPRRARAAGSARGARPPSLQVGAICWRLSGKGLRILLITSRDTGRWVIPKGWPMKKRADWDAAAREAWEEAGVQGAIGQQSIGLYTYRKMLPGGAYIPCAVRVYPLEVQSMRREYPETAQRSSKWFSPRKASRLVDEPELAALLRDFEPWLADPPPAPTEPVTDAQD